MFSRGRRLVSGVISKLHSGVGVGVGTAAALEQHEVCVFPYRLHAVVDQETLWGSSDVQLDAVGYRTCSSVHHGIATAANRFPACILKSREMCDGIIPYGQ